MPFAQSKAEPILDKKIVWKLFCSFKSIFEGFGRDQGKVRFNGGLLLYRIKQGLLDLRSFKKNHEILANPDLQELSNIVEAVSGEGWDREVYEKQAGENLPIFKKKLNRALELFPASGF